MNCDMCMHYIVCVAAFEYRLESTIFAILYIFIYLT